VRLVLTRARNVQTRNFGTRLRQRDKRVAKTYITHSTTLGQRPTCNAGYMDAKEEEQ
jgi:hypothetical protein